MLTIRKSKSSGTAAAAGTVGGHLSNSSSKYIDFDILDLTSKMGPRSGDKARSHAKEGRTHQSGNGHASWGGATELYINLKVEVGDRSFHLHKFPLISKSARLNRLVFESRDTEKDRILLSDIPGGAEAFETAARFLYGGKLELTSANVATVRCAAEYLEMTETLGEGNLVAKAEHFLNSVVLGSWRDSITVLKSCSELRPWAEELEIVRRCSESVAWKASTDPHGIRWSFSATGSGKDAPRDWWFEDVATLYIDTFSKVMKAVTVKGMRPSMVTAAVAYYAEKWLHLTKESDASTTIKTHVKEETQASFMAFTGFNQGIVAKDAKKTQHKNRAILQGIVSLLPPESESIAVKFLVKLLKVACVVNAGPLCKTDLAKRVGVQLDKVSMDDLLIPASGDSTYDIDVVQQIVEFYLQEQSNGASPPFSPTSSRKLAASVSGSSSPSRASSPSRSSRSSRSSSPSSRTSSSSVTSANLSISTSVTSASSISSRSSTSGRSISGSSSSERTISDDSSSSVSGRRSIGSGSSISRSSRSGSSSFTSSSSETMSGGSRRSSTTSHSRSNSSISIDTTSTSSLSGDESVKPEKDLKKFYTDDIPTRRSQLPNTTANLKVAQLLETYLEEVGKDSSIPLGKFMALAELFTQFPRESDDSIYRAIDAFLRAHPTLTELDRKKLCRIMDTQALSLNACMHASSNERLPLRVVVQVLFSEQVRLRNAMTSSVLIKDKDIASSLSSFSSSTSRSSSTSSSSDPSDSTGSSGGSSSSSSTGTGTSNSASTATTRTHMDSVSVASALSVSSIDPSPVPSFAPSLAPSISPSIVPSVVSSQLPGGLSIKETLRFAILEIEMLRKAVEEIDMVKARLSVMDSLQFDIESMALKFQDLAQDYSGMTQQVEELTKASKHKSGWSSGWKKMTKSFQTREEKHEKEVQERVQQQQQKINTYSELYKPESFHQISKPQTHHLETVNSLSAVKTQEPGTKPAKVLINSVATATPVPKDPPVKETIAPKLNIVTPKVVVQPPLQPGLVAPEILQEPEIKHLADAQIAEKVKEAAALETAAGRLKERAITRETHPKTGHGHGHRHPRGRHRSRTPPDYNVVRRHRDHDSMSVSSTGSSYVSTSFSASSASSRSRSGSRHKDGRSHRQGRDGLGFEDGHNHGRTTSRQHHHSRHHHHHHRSGRGSHRDGYQNQTPEHHGSLHHHRGKVDNTVHREVGGGSEHQSTASHHKLDQLPGSKHHSSHHGSSYGHKFEPHSSTVSNNKDGSEYQSSQHSRGHGKDLHRETPGSEHHSSHHGRRPRQKHRVDNGSNSGSEAEVVFKPSRRRHSVTR